MASDWFPLGVSDSTVHRITLDFGLRGANQHFLELVVPEIGGARYVRQLSWAVAGLAMRDQVGPHGSKLRATQLANAIEALGCKAEFVAGKSLDRVLGRRAFERDGDGVGSFKELRDRRHYVQNTFRGTVVRALRDAGGLGFARGSRFDGMILDPVGTSLGAALLDEMIAAQGNPRLRVWLGKWIAGEKEPVWPALRMALSPETPSKRERAIVRARLVDVDGKAADKRRELAAILEHEPHFPGVASVVRAVRRKNDRYAAEIELACAFGDLLDACIAVVVRLSAVIEAAGALSIVGAAKAVSNELGTVRARAKAYVARVNAAPGASSGAADHLSNTVASVNDPSLLEELLRRERRVLDLADRKVNKGPLFRNLTTSEDDIDEDPEPDDTSGRTFRLARFHELLRDARKR